MMMELLPAQYLRGVALFNEGRFFACHETWEEIWLTAAGAERAFLHALIQVAAALHHLQGGNRKGAASVYARARRKLEKSPSPMMRLDVGALIPKLDQFFATAEQAASLPPLPQITLQGCT